MSESPDRDTATLAHLAAGLWCGLPSRCRTWAPAHLLLRLLRSARSQALTRLAINHVARREGGVALSRSLRRTLLDRDGVLIGAFTNGPGIQLGALPPNTVIGRYASIGPHAVFANENHLLQRLSTSGLFFDPAAGTVATRRLPARPMLCIGHDVWIGANACVLPGCRRIGHGAVVGAGAVVTRDVPPLTIVAGNPARVLKHRLVGADAEAWLASRWWRHSPVTLLRAGADVREPNRLLPNLPASPDWPPDAIASDETFVLAAGHLLR